MSWARVDDGFHDHPKVDPLSLASIGLWTVCLTWAHRHRRKAIVPGHVPQARIERSAGKQAKVLTDELITAGLWESSPLGGVEIHDFADYLPKERDPAERREAGRKGAAKKWEGHSKPAGNLPADSMGSDSSRASAPASPPRPVSDASVGGDRNETLRAIPDTAPPTSDTCTRHPDGNPTDEPCRGCQRAEERRQRQADRSADKTARAREAAVRACRRCDGTWVIAEDGSPTRTKCDHGRRGVA